MYTSAKLFRAVYSVDNIMVAFVQVGSVFLNHLTYSTMIFLRVYVHNTTWVIFRGRLNERLLPRTADFVEANFFFYFYCCTIIIAGMQVTDFFPTVTLYFVIFLIC